MNLYSIIIIILHYQHRVCTQYNCYIFIYKRNTFERALIIDNGTSNVDRLYGFVKSTIATATELADILSIHDVNELNPEKLSSTANTYDIIVLSGSSPQQKDRKKYHNSIGNKKNNIRIMPGKDHNIFMPLKTALNPTTGSWAQKPIIGICMGNQLLRNIYDPHGVYSSFRGHFPALKGLIPIEVGPKDSTITTFDVYYACRYTIAANSHPENPFRVLATSPHGGAAAILYATDPLRIGFAFHPELHRKQSQGQKAFTRIMKLASSYNI